MPKRQTATPEENTASKVGLDDKEVQELPPETMRTRSGRKVRTPAALLDSQVPVRTPTRRTRRSVLQELPAAEEKNTQEAAPKLESVAEEKLAASLEPESGDGASPEPAEDIHPPGPAAAETPPAIPEGPPNKKPRSVSSVKPSAVIPLGKPKSGRVWKDRNKQRFSALLRDKPLCSSWNKKMEAKREKERVKNYTSQLKEHKIKQKEDKRKRREDTLKRRAENQRKSEIVQVINNTTKIKRMKKKQLRRIEKRDTLALLQKSPKQSAKGKRQKGPTVEKDLT
uniref:Coiled-coil domain-containing protein 86 n=1 Tax=Gasterosteus aculeatus aculeatus TaxID=481459 RepID=G3Q0A5_GASAC|nr:coiled-coil domain-containing protein 86 [Gasterosteus aculeatus aculeatus]